MYLSGLTASSRHAAVTAGKDRHPLKADVAQSDRAEQGKCRVPGRWFEPNRLHHRPGSARTMSERIGVPDMEMTMLAENCA